MADRLQGKVAIVTGAGGGIGRGEAMLLAAEGAAVIVNDLGGSTAGEGASRSPADTVVDDLSFKCVPDFLAVRGIAVLVLLSAMPLLMAGYLRFDHPQVYFQKVAVYLAIVAAIWLGAQPWRLRDFFEWLFAVPSRTRCVGGVLAAYGALLILVAFTY